MCVCVCGHTQFLRVFWVWLNKNKLKQKRSVDNTLRCNATFPTLEEPADQTVETMPPVEHVRVLTHVGKSSLRETDFVTVKSASFTYGIVLGFNICRNRSLEKKRGGNEMLKL